MYSPFCVYSWQFNSMAYVFVTKSTNYAICNSHKGHFQLFKDQMLLTKLIQNDTWTMEQSNEIWLKVDILSWDPRHVQVKRV